MERTESSRHKAVVRYLSLLLVAAGLATIGADDASARACPYRPDGHLNFRDTGTNPDRCAGVTSSNTNWTTFQGNWNDKADDFWNDHATGIDCIYQHANYRGANRTIYPGNAVSWSNIVSSNRTVAPTYGCPSGG